MNDLHFTTTRLTVHNWQPVIEDPAMRDRLLADLSAMLTPPVLQHLPPPLQQVDDLSAWIDARAAESDVYLVDQKTGGTIGLLILAPDPQAPGTIHVGYLLAERAWGKGLASELLSVLVTAMDGVRLVGGVAKDNIASARVLQKAGFVREADLSTKILDTYVHDSIPPLNH